MDKGKNMVAALKKHHFWVLAAIVILGGVAAWQVFAMGMQKDYNTKKQMLEGKKQEVVAIAGKPAHNEKTVARIQSFHGKQWDEVWKAWTYLYSVQSAKNPWPDEVGGRFLNWVRMRPNVEDDIPTDLRALYAMFIQNHLPKLKAELPARMSEYEWDQLRLAKLAPGEVKSAAAKLGPAAGPTAGGPMGPGGAGMGMPMPGGPRPAMPMPGGGMPGGYGAGMGASAQGPMEGIVYWDDYPKLEAAYYWETAPTAMQVRMAQEDLWVYWALVRIIRDTNLEVQNLSHATAAVKRILAMDIGQDAAMAFLASENRLFQSASSSSASSGSTASPSSGSSSGPGMPMPGGSMPSGMGMGMGMGMGGRPMPPPLPGRGGAMGMGPGGAYPGPSGSSGMGSTSSGAGAASAPTTMEEYYKAYDKYLKESRYLDDKYKPLTSETAPPFSEFKMMPVHLVLVMDHRRLPNFLAKCASSSMPVEVRKVWARNQQGEMTSSGSGTGMGMGMGMGMGGSGGYRGGSGSSSGYPGSSSGGSSGGYRGGSGGGYPSGAGSNPYGKTGSSAMPGRPGGAMPGGMSGSGGGSETPGPYDMTVEIEGIIYIFNPPDRTKLGKGRGDAPAEGTPAAPTGPAAPAAGTPAAPEGTPAADETVPDETVPDETVPDETMPDAADPAAPAAGTPAPTAPAAGTPAPAAAVPAKPAAPVPTTPGPAAPTPATPAPAAPAPATPATAPKG
jgi:hypothetical protein